MAEWTVVTVIVVLVGLVAAVAKPLISVTKTISRLTVVVEVLEKSTSQLTDKNSEAHRRIWQELDEHGGTLGGHETRITVLENTRKER